MANNPPPCPALTDLLTSLGLEIDPAILALASPSTRQVLDRTDALLTAEDAAVTEELEALRDLPRGRWPDELQSRLARAFGSPRWSLIGADFAAIREWAMQRGHAVSPEGALLLDPISFRGNLQDYAGAIPEARGAGRLVIADERASAFRLGPGAWSLAAKAAPDFILLGPSLAAGLPFAALLAYSEGCGQAPTDLSAASRASQAMALATLARLHRQPVHAELARLGERFRAALVASCLRDHLEITLTGSAAAMQFACQGQEDASAGQIAQHFQQELREQGLETRGDLLPNLDMDGANSEAIIAGIDRACSRIRTLLIEHNSYLSGGIRYVFPGGDARLRERGLCRYRYPKMADTRVEAEGDHLDITFAAGEMGEVTSSGFYLPTLLRGDLDVRLKYRICDWDPGPDSSCLALFFQNVASTSRYYSQRMSSGNPESPHTLLASLQAVLSEHRPVSGNEGEFRLTREGQMLRAWHRSKGDEEWLLLAADHDACLDDFIVGAKIWSKDRAGKLKTELYELQVEGEIPEEQLPMLEVREDPRKKLARTGSTDPDSEGNSD